MYSFERKVRFYEKRITFLSLRVMILPPQKGGSKPEKRLFFEPLCWNNNGIARSDPAESRRSLSQ